MSGIQQLREQLETMRASLRAFEHPAVEETAGLRLMHQTLRERESHIAQQIAKDETCSITLVFKGGGAAGPATAAPTITGVIEAVGGAIEAVGTLRATAPAQPADVAAALTPHLADASVDGDDVTVLLTRPPGALQAQPVDRETGAPLFEHAAVDFVEVVRNGSTAGEAALSAEIAPWLCRLANAVAAAGTVLDIGVDPFALDEVSVTVDQATAQRLALRCAGD